MRTRRSTARKKRKRANPDKNLRLSPTDSPRREASIKDGKLIIDNEGKEKKLINEVEQITFSGAYANKTNQPVMYITERAVFELRKDGVYLTEVAPGIDIKTQVIDQMGFEPKIDGEVKVMDERIFKDELMGLKK